MIKHCPISTCRGRLRPISFQEGGLRCERCRTIYTVQEIEDYYDRKLAAELCSKMEGKRELTEWEMEQVCRLLKIYAEESI